MRGATAGSAAIFALATAWGLISILVREVHLPALTLVFWRVALGAVAVGIGLTLAGRRASLRPPPPKVLAIGVVLAIHWSFYFASIRATSVASANLVTYANPILVALLAPAFLGERVPRVSVIALGLSVLGIVVIGVGGPTSGSGAVRAGGIGLATLAAVSYAFLILGLKRWAGKVDPASIALWHCMIAAVVLSPAAFTSAYGALDVREVLYVVLLGVVLTGASALVYMSALRTVPATSAGILAYMEPVSAALLAVALLGEQLSWAVVLGGALIVVAGSAVVAASRGGPAPAPAPALNP